MKTLQQLQRLIPRDALLWLVQQPSDTIFTMDSSTECFLGKWLTAAAGHSIVCPQDTLYLEAQRFTGPGVPAPKWMATLLSDLIHEARKLRIGNPVETPYGITAAQITPILQQAAFNWIPDASMRDMAAFMKTLEPDTEIDTGDDRKCLIAQFADWALALTSKVNGPACGFYTLDWGKLPVQRLPEWMQDIQLPMGTTTVLGLRRRLGKLSRNPAYASEYHKL